MIATTMNGLPANATNRALDPPHAQAPLTLHVRNLLAPPFKHHTLSGSGGERGETRRKWRGEKRREQSEKSHTSTRTEGTGVSVACSSNVVAPNNP